MFVEIFNELLAENELNKKQFSEQSGIPYPTIIGWTNLNRLPDYTALIKIANFFQCSVDYLMGRQESSIVHSYSATGLLPVERTFLANYRRLNTENKELVYKLTKNLSEK